MGVPKIAIHPTGSASPAHCDATVLILTSSAQGAETAFAAELKAATAIDAAFAATPQVLSCSHACGGRLIVAHTGPLTRDYDDARRVGEAVTKAIKRAVQAGASAPFLLLPAFDGAGADYARAHEVAIAAACSAVQTSIQHRDAVPHAETVREIVVGVWGGTPVGDATARHVAAAEVGKRLCRDVCGADPERMCPLNIVTHLTSEFEGLPVTMSVTTDLEALRTGYPLLHAVSRASLHVPRHFPAVVRLEYVGEGPIAKTLYLAGKGVTFDSGGVSIKLDSAGMSRDKGGAAAAAGFIRALAELRPPGVRAVAYLGLVRNSVGSESFVPDEIITSRAGQRVQIVNTDAEGRLVLSDLLSAIREEIVAAPASAGTTAVFSLATLTGHAVLSVGTGYSIAMENGPARKLAVAQTLQKAGHLYGDPFEISTIRREDFDFVAPMVPDYDVKQGNTAPSVATKRGSQFPAAVLLLASGLAKHGNESTHPIAFTHLDIAGSAVVGAPNMADGTATGAPITALLAAYVF